MRPWTIGLLLSIVAGACVQTVSPSRTFDAYEHKAKHTAEVVRSSVQTARLTARLASRGDTFGPYTSVILSDAEDGAAHAHAVFDSIQPPDAHSDRLRKELGQLLDRADEGLSTLRIAARRGELGRLRSLARPLGRLSRRLDSFTTRHG
jgi:hypothetical protein